MEKEDILCTMLSEPVKNIISIYFFWKNSEQITDSLYQYVRDRNLDIIETAQLNILSHLYSTTYFGGFDMSRFALIGRHENRAAFFSKLSELTGKTVPGAVHENQTKPDPERLEMENSPKTIAQLRTILSDDIRFYETHCT